EVAFNNENKKPETFAQSLGWMFGQRIGGRGLFTETNHEKWSMQRKLFDPAFRKKYLLGLLGIFNQCADEAVNYLSQFGDGKIEVKMADVCGRVTLDTIGKSTFGMKDLNVIADPDNKLTKAISYVFKAGSILFHNSIIAEEVDEVIGDKEDITQNELNKLEYMARLFKETLRLYGPAGGIHKICAKEFIACGFRIPANTFLMLHHQAMIADEQFFDEPDKFDPERWINEDRRRMYAYLPFGLGPRSCIGQNFALMEAKVVLAKFIQRFDISLVPGQSFTMITEVTSKPKDGTLCYLKSRKH
ncbi:putative cholesterol 24-hydroxylase-like, partial [Apostichopus japonicus]